MKKAILTLLLLIACGVTYADPIPLEPPDIGDVGMPCEHRAPVHLIRMKEKTYTLDTSGFTSGLYVIRVIAGDEICYDKIIIR